MVLYTGTGINISGQLGDNTTTQRHVFTASNGTTASSIACGNSHSMIIKSDGTVHGTGNNTKGQLGDNSGTNRICVYCFKMAQQLVQ